MDRSAQRWSALYQALVPAVRDSCGQEAFAAVAAAEHGVAQEAASAALLAELPHRTAFIDPPRVDWEVVDTELVPEGGVVTRRPVAEGRPMASLDARERWVLHEGSWWLAPDDLTSRCQNPPENPSVPGAPPEAPSAIGTAIAVPTGAGSATLTLLDARRGGALPITGPPPPDGFEHVYVEVEARGQGVASRFHAVSFDGLLYDGVPRWERHACLGAGALDPSCQRHIGLVLIGANDGAPWLAWSAEPAQDAFTVDASWWLPALRGVESAGEDELGSPLGEGRLPSASWPQTDFSRQTPGFGQLVDTGLGRNRVTAIVAPRYESVREASRWLAPQEPVQVVERNGQARAYPLRILIWHEIVNDVLDGDRILVTYCPLCNTALAFERPVGIRDVAFRTSGVLRNSNLVMYDDWTESWWQQATGDAIVGRLAGAKLTAIPSLIVSWEDFRAAHPDGDVLSLDSGFERDYDFNPYLNYDLGGEVDYFVGEPDPRLPVLARVLGVEAGGEAMAFRFSDLTSQPAVNTEVGGEPVAVFYARGTSSALQAFRVDLGRDVGSAVAFDPVVDGTRLTFAPLVPGAWRDEQTGSTWSLLGEAAEGPLAGARMRRLVQDNGFWFSWAAFHPGTAIFGR